MPRTRRVAVKPCSKSFGGNKKKIAECKANHYDSKTRTALKEAKETVNATAKKGGKCKKRAASYAKKVNDTIHDAKMKGPNSKVRAKVGTLEAGKQIQAIEKHCN